MLIIKKNDIVKLLITDMTAEGSGVGHITGMGADDGTAVFVPSAACGDEIMCRITKVCSGYCYGIAEQLLIPSADRLDRGCDVKKTCGGCVFRHISYESELKIKETTVKNAFIRIGGFEEGSFDFLPILACENSDRYRNKAQYPVAADKDGRVICGFYAPRSHRVIPCGDCMLQPEIFSEITREILAYANIHKIVPYNEETGKGLFRHIYLRRGWHSGEIMVCFIAAQENKKVFLPLAQQLAKKFCDIESVVLNINSKRTNVIAGERNIVLYGRSEITDVMCKNKISISPLSFYQVNTPQAERLYETAADFAALTGSEEVLDLYCGAGTIGLFLAGRAGRVTGAEIIPQAVENARKNAEANGIENADFICADAGQAADALASEGRRPDVIITDPPRKGCDRLTLDSMIKMAPDRIVMISCNPATAARDCRYLAENGYRLLKLQSADLFPATGHVECAALMKRE